MDRKRINKEAMEASKSKQGPDRLYDKDLLINLAIKQIQADKMKVNLDIQRIDVKREKLLNKKKSNEKMRRALHSSINYGSKESLDASVGRLSLDNGSKLSKANADMDDVIIDIRNEQEHNTL